MQTLSELVLPTRSELETEDATSRRRRRDANTLALDADILSVFENREWVGDKKCIEYYRVVQRYLYKHWPDIKLNQLTIEPCQASIDNSDNDTENSSAGAVLVVVKSDCDSVGSGGGSGGSGEDFELVSDITKKTATKKQILKWKHLPVVLAPVIGAFLSALFREFVLLG